MLGIGRSLAYQAAARGQIPTIRVGRKLLVPLARLDQLLSGRNENEAPDGNRDLAEDADAGGDHGTG